jgi:uncharacterized membrane protein
LGLFFAFLSAATYTTSNLLIKKGMLKGHNNTGYLITVFCNVILLGIFFLISLISIEFQVSWLGILVFMVAGILTTGLGRLTYFISINNIGPSRSSAIKNSSPIFALLFAFILLNERITLGPSIGIALIILTFIYQGAHLFKNKSGIESEIDNSYIGYSIALVSALCFGIGQGIRKQGLFIMDNPFLGAWIGALATFIFFLVIELCRGRLKEEYQEIRHAINRTFIMIGILTSLGILFFFIAVSFTKLAYVSTIAAIEPLLTIFFSTLLFKGQEKLTLTNWIVACLIFIGILTIVWFS